MIDTKKNKQKKFNKYNSYAGEVKAVYKTSKKFPKLKLSSSEDAYSYFKNRVFDMDTIEHHESFWILFLNRCNKVVGIYLVGEGGTTGCIVDIKMVIQMALLTGTQGMILAHNHPSGNLKASHEDIKLTNKLKDAGKLFDIIIFDHIILSVDSYYSFSDEGVL